MLSILPFARSQWSSRPLGAHLIALGLAICFPLIVAGVYVGWRVERDRSSAAEEHALELARISADELGSVLRNAQFGLTDLAARAELIATARNGECDATMAPATALNLPLARISIVDADGTLLCDGAGSWRARKLNAADRKWFQDVRTVGGFVTGDLVIARSTGIATLPLAMAVVGPRGEFRGAIVAPVESRYLTFSAARSGLRQGAVIALVDQNGSIAAGSPASALLPGDRLFNEIADFVQQSERAEGIGTRQFRDGVERFYAWRRVPESSYAVYVAFDAREIRQNVSTFWAVLAAALLVATSGAVGIGILATRALRREAASLAETLIRSDFQSPMPIVPGSRLIGLAERARVLANDRDKFADAALRDSLTGAANRRAFDGALAVAACEAQRFKRPLGLITLDVDHFKKINDKHGHPIGDAVLKGLVARITSMLRDSDRVFRIGGEEFAIIVSAPRDIVTDVAERVRRTVANEPIAGVPTTVSIGIADGTSCQSEPYLQRADEALYRAKRAGRNRVEIIGAPQPGPIEAPPCAGGCHKVFRTGRDASRVSLAVRVAS